MTAETSSRKRFEIQLAMLVEKFERNHNDYMRADYSETDARVELIDPLFEALGWDVRNEKTREVVREKREHGGRSDYRFRVEGRTLFFVEAKAPHASLDNNAVLQAKKYAWSEPDPRNIVYFVVLTNFREFYLYDASRKPDPNQPLKGHVFELSYKQYLTPSGLENLWMLSRTAVPASLDKLLTPAQRAARERTPLDQRFLNDLTTWREQLAKAVFKEHSDLTPPDLNRVVQTFLDRLIFIRVAEDRGVLPQGELVKIARDWRHEGRTRPIAADLIPLFREVNDKLNGEIFKSREVENINWDSELVAKIIEQDLEPYDFARIPVELLGSIYERYLGKVIHITGKRVQVKDKPEVRKAGGVYYTPKYIVDYIVEQTVGKLIEGKTPKQIEGLRILDPACGSGSFLLGAYQKLLDYHKQYNLKHARASSTNAAQARFIEAEEDGEFKLPLDVKAAILRNNIFGVDIDPQAVEITMMSLYVKMLEGEHGAIAGQAVLPRLRDNIKCGNALIGYDIGNLSEEDQARINPFDWNSKSEGFSEIMGAGGFDAVIGNPPWGATFSQTEKDYLRDKFAESHVRTPESFNYFLTQMRRCANNTGDVGLIIPSSFLTQHEFWKTRKLLVETDSLYRICNLGDGVFQHVTAPCCIIIFRHMKTQDHTIYLDLRREERENLPTALLTEENGQDAVGIGNVSDSFMLQIQSGAKIIHKCSTWPSLKEIAEDVATGISSGLDVAYIYEQKEAQRLKLERALLRKLVIGGEINRYALTPISGKQIIYVARETQIENYPHCLAALQEYRERLKKRVETASGLIPWYSLYRPRRSKLFDKPKILIRQTADHIMATLDLDQWYCLKSAIIVQLPDASQMRYEYLLGLLNSRLVRFLYDNLVGERARVFPEVKPIQLFKLPIRAINFSDPADKSRHDKLVALVERMLDLHKQKHVAKSETARVRIEREINVTDEQIDALAYELYGLTKEEIKIVEEGTR